MAEVALIDQSGISTVSNQGHCGVLLEIIVDLTFAVTLAVHEAERNVNEVEREPGLRTTEQADSVDTSRTSYHV